MMPLKPVAAKEGAMKQKRNSRRFMLFDANIIMHCWENQLLANNDQPL